jgi:hypothetical protein
MTVVSECNVRIEVVCDDNFVSGRAMTRARNAVTRFLARLFLDSIALTFLRIVSKPIMYNGKGEGSVSCQVSAVAEGGRQRAMNACVCAMREKTPTPHKRSRLQGHNDAHIPTATKRQQSTNQMQTYM